MEQFTIVTILVVGMYDSTIYGTHRTPTPDTDDDVLIFLSSRNFHPTVLICTSIEDVLDLNESSVNSFYDKNIIICVDYSIPDSFGNTSESHVTL